MTTETGLLDVATQRAMIANTMSRYAWAYDMNDMALLATCFTEDAQVTFGTGLKIGREAVVEELTRRRSIYRPEQVPWHIVTNIFITPDTENSVKVASWFAFGPMTPDQPGALESFGWYDDRFKIEDGDWRVSYRRVLRTFDR